MFNIYIVSRHYVMCRAYVYTLTINQTVQNIRVLVSNHPPPVAKTTFCKNNYFNLDEWYPCKLSPVLACI